jgi:hypothetical protein
MDYPELLSMNHFGKTIPNPGWKTQPLHPEL